MWQFVIFDYGEVTESYHWERCGEKCTFPHDTHLNVWWSCRCAYHSLGNVNGGLINGPRGWQEPSPGPPCPPHPGPRDGVKDIERSKPRRQANAFAHTRGAGNPLGTVESEDECVQCFPCGAFAHTRGAENPSGEAQSSNYAFANFAHEESEYTDNSSKVRSVIN